MVDVSIENAKRLAEMSKRIRLNGLEMAVAAGGKGAHLGGSMSCVEILAVLYGEIMRYDVSNPLDPGRDKFIPSKSHCVLAHIPALAQVGYITHQETLEFQKNAGRLNGHARHPEIGMEYSGGSLGMAISVGIGMALGSRERGRGNRIYILLGDGELDEGSVWEGFMSAAHYKLDNLIAIVDRNHLSYDGDTESVMGLGDLPEKLRSFGWHVSVCDGHDTYELLQAFADTKPGKPHAIVAETIKGKGVSFMENKPEWHHHTLSQKEYEQAVAEINGGQ